MTSLSRHTRIQNIPELKILGDPVMCGFSVTTTKESGIDIFVFAEALKPSGWKLNHNIKPKRSVRAR
jgi:hypothetical protein